MAYQPSPLGPENKSTPTIFSLLGCPQVMVRVVGAHGGAWILQALTHLKYLSDISLQEATTSQFTSLILM